MKNFNKNGDTIDLVCFGHLEAQTIGAGLIFGPFANYLEKMNYLGRLFALTYSETNIQYPSVITPIPYAKNMIRIINRALGFFHMGYHIRRGVQERLFDYSLTKRSSDILGNKILFSHESFPRAVIEAKQKGCVTYLLAPVPHCDVVRELVSLEQQRMGLGFRNESYTSEFRLSKMREFYSNVDFILTGSSVIKESFIKKGLSSKLIHGNFHFGLDERTIIENKGNICSTFHVFYVANTKILKGLHYLLEAWQKLALPNAELVIGGTIHEDVKQIIQARYADVPNVIYMGYVADLSEYYRSANLVVCPSLIDGGPRTVWEAIACHTPVLATENCGASDILRDYKNGFVVPICDSEAIAERILHLYEHRDEGKEMAERALKEARKYSIEMLNKQILHLLLESSPG